MKESNLPKCLELIDQIRDEERVVIQKIRSGTFAVICVR